MNPVAVTRYAGLIGYYEKHEYRDIERKEFYDKDWNDKKWRRNYLKFMREIFLLL